MKQLDKWKVKKGGANLQYKTYRGCHHFPSIFPPLSLSLFLLFPVDLLTDPTQVGLKDDYTGVLMTTNSNNNARSIETNSSISHSWNQFFYPSLFKPILLSLTLQTNSSIPHSSNQFFYPSLLNHFKPNVVYNWSHICRTKNASTKWYRLCDLHHHTLMTKDIILTRTGVNTEVWMHHSVNW